MSSVSANGAVFHGPVASSSTAVARAASTRARARSSSSSSAASSREAFASHRARDVGRRGLTRDVATLFLLRKRHIPSIVDARATPRDEGTDRAHDMVVPR
jgi:hypothetical protein